MRYKALGIHVFGGGFSRGVQEHPSFEVLGQLEIHGLGKQTTEQVLGIPVFMGEDWRDWPKIPCDVCYGNPRCTGFSCLTSGYDGNAHGPWAKQTKDVHDLIDYSLSLDPQPGVICWESVQQAYSVGKPLLNHLRDDKLVPCGYRIAHLFVNAASFGNAQQRKRYFMFCYKAGKNMNASLPDIPQYRTTLRDAIGHLQDAKTTTYPFGSTDYTPDSYVQLNSTWQDDWQEVIDMLPRGYDFNIFAKHHADKLPPRMQEIWKYRSSDLPFSMHCPYRCAYDVPSPTLWGQCLLVHPIHNRLLTIRELSVIMGWDFCPVGEKPVGQICKGIVPTVGTWLAEQARAYLDDDWGSDDFASTYDAKLGAFTEGPNDGTEKVFRLTEYRAHRDKPELENWQDIPVSRRPWVANT